MSTVEDRIVEMKFENGSFMRNAVATLGILDRLKSSLNFSQSKTALTDLNASAKSTNFNHLAASVDAVNARFSALSTVAITTLATITSRAVNAGLNFSRAFTIGPISDGFADFNQKLTSVQTITNATGLSVQKVNTYFDELDTYADKTVFNLTDMTSALAKFTNAGVDLDVSVPAIKGIANMTALAGQGANEASIAFYNLSQSIGNGFMTTSDFRSLNLANVATKEWKDNLVQAAVEAGTLKKTGKDTFAIMSDGSEAAATSAQLFTEELSRGWANADILTKVLGDYGNTQTAIGKKAQAAAQDVKSLPMMIDTLKAAVGTTWTDTFEIILGDLNESKELFTGLTNTIGGWLGAMGDARNELLGGWKDLGGRTILIEALKKAFDGILDVIHPIRLAFRDIFPATTARDLLKLTKAFRRFAEDMSLGEDTMENLRRTFRGVFAVFDIGFKVVKGILGVFGDLFGAVGEGSGGFLEFTGDLGDFLVALNEAIEKGDGLTKFFEGISTVLQVPIQLISAFFKLLMNSGDAAQGASDALGVLQERFGPLMTVARALGAAWEFFVDILEKAFGFMDPLIDGIAQAFTGLGDAIANSMATGNFDNVLDILNTGLFAVIALAIRKFFSNGLNIDFGGGFLGSMKETFDTLTGSMKAMQTQIQAKTLLLIAGAIALLTASVVALSLVDSDNLTKALVAMTASFTQLLGAMAVLVKISGSAGFVKLPIVAASMVLLAAAMVEMSLAVALMGQLDWTTIAKGLVGIGGALVAIAIGMTLMPKRMLLQSASLVALSVALNAIALAIAGLGQLSWETIGKGLLTITAALIGIGAAMRLMPKGMVLQAAALVAISGALNVIALAIAGLGQLGWESIAKGLVALGGALLILAGGLTLMNGTIVGSLALLIASKALVKLGLVLAGLGLLGWDQIAKGLFTLAAALTVIGVAGLLLAPVIVPLLGLGLALTGIGTGLALAGAAALAFATAFSIFTAAGTAGVVVFTGLVAALIGLIPQLLENIALGLIGFARVIGEGAPAIVGAFINILLEMLNGIIKTLPKIGEAFSAIVQTGLKVLRDNFPDLVNTGLQLLLKLIEGVTNNLGEITEATTKLVEKFVETMGSERNIARLATAALQFMVNLLNGLAIAIENQTDALIAAGENIAGAVAQGMVKGAASFSPAGMVGSLAGKLIGGLRDKLEIESPSKVTAEMGRYTAMGLAQGLESETEMVKRSAEGVANGALSVISTTMQKVADAANTQIDLVPTITPVLDLTRMANEASKIGSLLATNPLSADLSLSQATAIARSSEDVAAATTPVVRTVEAKFEQNIHSPKAIDAEEVWRDTKSLFALAKEALDGS